MSVERMTYRMQIINATTDYANAFLCEECRLLGCGTV
jgi:hypothetical protein